MPFESVTVGMFSILQCKHEDDARCPLLPGDATKREYNSVRTSNPRISVLVPISDNACACLQVFLGWTRDGFHWSRPPAPRRPFLPYALPEPGATTESRGPWNREDVQSV